jgi:glycerol-3-phosphate cytidylyltransferase
MIEEAKRQCDYLIVGLQLDPSLDRPEKNSPSQSIIERYIQLKGSKHIDEVVPYVSEQDLEDILRSFKIDVRIIGEEYRIKISLEEIIVSKRELRFIIILEITGFLHQILGTK